MRKTWVAAWVIVALLIPIGIALSLYFASRRPTDVPVEKPSRVDAVAPAPEAPATAPTAPAASATPEPSSAAAPVDSKATSAAAQRVRPAKPARHIEVRKRAAPSSLLRTQR